jgi:hypothetical protein
MALNTCGVFTLFAYGIKLPVGGTMILVGSAMLVYALWSGHV